MHFKYNLPKEAQPVMQTVLTYESDFCQQNNAPFQTAKDIQESFKEHEKMLS